MKQFHSIFLLVLLSLSLSSCDLFRKIAGRPTAADIEKKRSALEMEQKAHNDRLDSLKLLQTQISDSLAALDSIRLQGSSIVEARQLTDQEKSRLPYSYYVIVGAFGNPENAGRFAQQASEAGYPSTLTRYRNGFTAVGVCPTDRIVDASESLKAVRQSGLCPDAWILNNR